VRGFFARSSQDQSVTDIRRGGTPSVERAGLPYTLASHYGYDSLAEHLRIDQDLQARFTDYEEMDEYPEISVALDIYADDACTPNLDREEAIWVTSKDKATADELMLMLHTHLTVEDDIWGSARTLCKYGNNFGELLVSDKGVIGVNYLPPPTMRRVEDTKGNLLGFLQDVRGEFNITMEDFYALAQERSGKARSAVAASGALRNRGPGELTVFEDWEVIHWRLRGKHLRSVYGHAVIEPARWVWKRLALLEDALLIYKLERAPSRYAFYIDVGQLDAERGLAHVNRVKNSFTRKKFVKPDGKLDMRYNPLSHDEDFFIPVRDGKRSTEVDVIQGPDYTETDSLEYHRDKLVSALKIPKVYMGYGGDEVTGELSTHDIRFARAVMRIQRCLRGGYRKACRVHLIAVGKDPDKHDYQVHMTVPSSILELARMEVMNTTADLAGRMGEMVSTKWILVHLFKFTEEEAIRVMEERREEQMKAGAVEAQVQKMAMGENRVAWSKDEQEQGQSAATLNGTQHMEMRLSKLIKAVRRDDWRKEFNRGDKATEKRAERKLDRLLKENAGVNKRVRELGGLLMDIRKTMQAEASP
jgi:hypothetical protein